MPQPERSLLGRPVATDGLRRIVGAARDDAHDGLVENRRIRRRSEKRLDAERHEALQGVLLDGRGLLQLTVDELLHGRDKPLPVRTGEAPEEDPDEAAAEAAPRLSAGMVWTALSAAAWPDRTYSSTAGRAALRP